MQGFQWLLGRRWGRMLCQTMDIPSAWMMFSNHIASRRLLPDMHSPEGLFFLDAFASVSALVSESSWSTLRSASTSNSYSNWLVCSKVESLTMGDDIDYLCCGGEVWEGVDEWMMRSGCTEDAAMSKDPDVHIFQVWVDGTHACFSHKSKIHIWYNTNIYKLLKGQVTNYTGHYSTGITTLSLSWDFLMVTVRTPWSNLVETFCVSTGQGSHIFITWKHSISGVAGRLFCHDVGSCLIHLIDGLRVYECNLSNPPAWPQKIKTYLKSWKHLHLTETGLPWAFPFWQPFLQ